MNVSFWIARIVEHTEHVGRDEMSTAKATEAREATMAKNFILVMGGRSLGICLVSVG
jgi:hypothetical protein